MKSFKNIARATQRAEKLIAAAVGHYPRKHPWRAAGIVSAALLGSAVTAFGVAPLTAVEPPPPATRVVTESVTPDGLKAQLDELALHEMSLSRQDLLRSSDTADTLLARLGIDDSEAANFLRSDATARSIFEGRAGKIVQAVADETPASRRLMQLVVRGPAADRDQLATRFTRITITRSANGFAASTEQVPLSTEVKLASGTIDSSLFAAADLAHVPDSVTSQLAEIFSTDIDFRRELRRGDTFSVSYEALTADGEPITWGASSGRVLAARFVNAGRTHDAVWFDDGTHGAYYDLQGQSKQRSFLASPVAFSRVTSGFAMRFHPILQQWRQHKGIDYAAPTGTPVRAVGAGSVEFAGVQNGYGNVVILRHANDRETVYAHLSRIDVRRGQHVDAGSTIGAVGMTGWATGPHLHFELKVHGQQINPTTLARQSEAVHVAPSAQARFEQMAAQARIELSTGTVASASPLME